MRAQFDIRNRSLVEHPHFNRAAPYPTWYPGRGWEAAFPYHEIVMYFLTRPLLAWKIVAVYLLAIIVGQWAMAARRPFELNRVLVVWNMAHSLFSTAALYTLWPYALHTIATRGFTSLVCDLPPYQRRNHAVWYTLIGLSRLAELGDTAFLVLRKRSVIHLHWIHHSLVVVLLFILLEYFPVFLITAATINLTIHAVMYAYYAARAAGIRVPRRFAVWITRAQIIQMFLGLAITAWVYYVMDWTPRPCHSHPLAVQLGLVTCVLFAGLFINYFIQSYIVKKSRKNIVKKE